MSTPKPGPPSTLTPGRVAALMALVHQLDLEYKTCRECQQYALRRFKVLSAAMSQEIRRTGETSEQCIDRYMNGVHDRHVAGQPI